MKHQIDRIILKEATESDVDEANKLMYRELAVEIIKKVPFEELEKMFLFKTETRGIMDYGTEVRFKAMLLKNYDENQNS